MFLQTHRIGAALICVAQALDTSMFSSDVTQVQALHKSMEQLMIHKQVAKEVVWELLMDVLFLRTGNADYWQHQHHGMTNPFLNRQIRSALAYNLQVSSLSQMQDSVEVQDAFLYDGEDKAIISIVIPIQNHGSRI
jgi:hypothetical protein